MINSTQILQFINNNENVLSYIIIVITLLLFIWIIYYLVRLDTMQKSGCNYMKSLYPELNGFIKAINRRDENCGHTLNDYYIKTSYNSCSGGNYSYDYVDTCTLKYVISTGARCLDMAVYSIDDQPVVATSINDDYFIKESLNSVPFKDVMKVIKDYAFSSGTCSNYTDPLILHLRLRSNNPKMYENMSSLFGNYNELLLGKRYSYGSFGNNITNQPLLDFCGKIIIIIDKHEQTVMDNSPLMEFINLTSNSNYFRQYRFDDMERNADKNELLFFNKKAMTIVLPNNTSNPPNPDGLVSRNLGCQMVAMRFQLNDNNLKENTKFFNECGYAFCLRPKEFSDY